MRRRLTVLALMLAALSGCALDPAVEKFSGESHADPTLKSDTLGIVRLLMHGRGCREQIDHIDSKVLHYEPTTGTSGHSWGRENWVVTACGRPFYFNIEFIEDGHGGSFFAVSS